MKKIKLYNCSINILIDDEDFDKLIFYNWRLHNDGNKVEAIINEQHVYIARFLLDEWDPKINIDHKDRNIFNNQKENLRKATKSQNAMNRSEQSNNSSGYKGVWWNTAKQKWQASIVADKQKYHLGFYLIKENAARAYNRAALKYHGEFAWLNKIPND